MQKDIPYKEQEILLRISEGDEIAFTQLVNKFSDLLGSYIFKLTNSREQAEEIVQDVFLKIWMTRESLTEVKNFRVWLYVISKNQALNALRKVIQERIKQTEWRAGVTISVLENTDDLKERQLGLIDQAIALLPPQQKMVYLLSRKKGLKHKEIAKEMNLSQETVKKYIQIAVKTITKYVEAHLEIGLILLFLGKR